MSDEPRRSERLTRPSLNALEQRETEAWIRSQQQPIPTDDGRGSTHTQSTSSSRRSSRRSSKQPESSTRPSQIEQLCKKAESLKQELLTATHEKELMKLEQREEDRRIKREKKDNIIKIEEERKEQELKREEERIVREEEKNVQE